MTAAALLAGDSQNCPQKSPNVPLSPQNYHQNSGAELLSHLKRAWQPPLSFSPEQSPEDAAWEGVGSIAEGEKLRQLCGPTKDKLYLDFPHLPYECLPAGMEEQGVEGEGLPGSPLPWPGRLKWTEGPGSHTKDGSEINPWVTRQPAA